MYESYLDCYRPDPDPNSPHFRIKITKPPYADVVLILGKTLSATEDRKVNFSYEILYHPPSVDVTSEGLVELMGGIVLAIMERQFKNEAGSNEGHDNTEPNGSVSGPGNHT